MDEEGERPPLGAWRRLRSETTTKVICLVIRGATLIHSFLSVLGRVLMSLLNLASSIRPQNGLLKKAPS